MEDTLANLASAKKRIRQNAKRRIRNRIYSSQARTYVKRARIALETNDAESAIDAVRQAVSKLDRAASKGVIHRKNAARRKSRLMKRLAALEETS
jgi:small subunit ribosomal protein S20